MPGQRTLLRWGPALERGTGAPSANAEGQDDLRNVLVLDGALRQRGGLGPAAAAVSGADMVVGIGLFQAISKTILVVYNTTTRVVSVHAADLTGNNATLVGTWGTLPASAQAPPRVTMAESFSILVLAHDEPNVAQRLPTMRYDPSLPGPSPAPWEAVTANLDGLGTHPVRARLVWTHLGYLWYAGYGSNSQPARAEIVRVSRADNPVVLDPQHYFLVGTRDAPVLAGASVRDVLLVFKGDSIYRITGGSRATWEIEPMDAVTGIVGPRAHYFLNGQLYFWALDGPRVTDGVTVQPVDFALDPLGRRPAGLPAMGPGEGCFTAFVSEARHLLFCFPLPGQSRTLAFALSLWRPDAPRWSYWALEAPVLCAALTAPGVPVVAVPPGFASAVTTSGSVGEATGSVSVTWTHNDAVGDESVELWYKPAAGAWSLAATVPVATGNPTQTAAFSAGVVAGAYEVQVRYRRGTQVRDTYQSADPDTWPAGSRGTGTVIIIAVPVITSLVYNPQTGLASLAWTMATTTAEIVIEIRAEAEWVWPEAVVATVTLPAGTLAHNLASAAPGDPLWFLRITPRTMRLRMRGKIGAALGAWTPFQNRFIGVDQPPSGVVATFDRWSVATGTRVRLDWVNSPAVPAFASGETDYGFTYWWTIPQNAGGPAQWSPGVLFLGVVPLSQEFAVGTLPSNFACQLVGQTVVGHGGRVRHRLTSSAGIENFTPWAHVTPAWGEISAVCVA